MINIRSVRLGNYVYDTIGRIVQLDIELMKHLLDNPNEYSPIELTHKILVSNCDFVKDDLGYSGYQDFKIYHSVKDGVMRPCFHENIASESRLHYLHQLQNAFLVIEGYELPIRFNNDEN